MADTDNPIPDDEWRTIFANVPLVSVDLVIEHDGGVLLGKRENDPAKGEWFVPGACRITARVVITGASRPGTLSHGESV